MSRCGGFSVGLWAIALFLGVQPSVGWSDEPSSSQQPHTVFRLAIPDLPLKSPAVDPPLGPVIKMAAAAYEHIRAEVRDYTCVMIRQERVNGRLRPHEFIYAKVRHRQLVNDRLHVPFSVYLKFLKPASVAGREVLYVEGQNGGEMFARRGGTRFAFVTTKLHPESDLAMRWNRYPITEFGIENMLFRLLQQAKHDLNSHCRVDLLEDATFNDRPARGIIVTQQSPQESPDFYQARVFVDKQFDLPVHFESYDWPKTADGKPEIIERYSYLQLQFNRGLTDADFSEDNPQYQVK